MEFEKAKNYIEEFLQSRLSPDIFYHDYFHTLDVLKACTDIAKAENITEPSELLILKTAALFHDCGFVNVYNEHEEEGCRVAREILPGFSYSFSQVNVICDLIMATKLPQQPITNLQKILCDADLDYLGRDDYKITAQKLFNEWKERGKIHSEKEWVEMQIKFLESHHYWTNSSMAARQMQKENNIENLKKIVLD